MQLLPDEGALCSFTQLALCQTPKKQTLFEALRQGKELIVREAIK
jgi:hypothetical protein